MEPSKSLLNTFVIVEGANRQQSRLPCSLVMPTQFETHSAPEQLERPLTQIAHPFLYQGAFQLAFPS